MSSQQNGSSDTHQNEVPTAMSTSALEKKLKQLKDKSNDHSQILTQKLASSQSGQNLLHIGTSLSTLPPGLHSLLTQIHPVLSATEQAEKEHHDSLKKLVEKANKIRAEQRRVRHAQTAADLYADFVAAEECVQKDQAYRKTPQQDADELEHAAALERAAHNTLCLIEELHKATETVSEITKMPTNEEEKALPSLRSSLPQDSELAQFLLKLAPRIRRLEADISVCLTQRMEHILHTWNDQQTEEVLWQLGHVMRGLALLGYGKEIESTFARVGIMPFIRSQVSMGRLDEGGPRGECAGLPSLLEEISSTIAAKYGPILRFSESMFNFDDQIEVDLVTAGVWAPIATALMADAGIKMAIFSPGIASILQSNYIALDLFLSKLADRLLRPTQNGASSLDDIAGELDKKAIEKAQNRIYLHSKTVEFSKKWNLPIYYQLRFGEACSRLNRAIESTRSDGWVAEVFSGPQDLAASYKKDIGFELPLFLELYDTLLWMWNEDVILKPLSHRFLRGAVQLVGRSVAFVEESMNGEILFGGETEEAINGDHDGVSQDELARPKRKQYCWGDNEHDVAAVAWELAILDTTLQHDYVDYITGRLSCGEANSADDTRSIVTDVLKEGLQGLEPLIRTAWNDRIVKILAKKCSAPLGAVKIIATNYRLTNRPPPTHASTYVASILKPLKEFDNDFASRVPHQIGSSWKLAIVSDVSEKYAKAVEDLLATAQKTEAALRSRSTRRTSTGGLSDGDKVKLQVYLDVVDFEKMVAGLGIDPDNVPGLSKLKVQSSEGVELQDRATNGND